MEDPLIISLAVSGVGILMLFVTLAVLYALIYLMTALIKDRPVAGAQAKEEREQDAGSEGTGAAIRKQRAATIAAVTAVTLARAELDLASANIEAMGEAAGVSAWRALHHQRRLAHGQRARKSR